MTYPPFNNPTALIASSLLAILLNSALPGNGSAQLLSKRTSPQDVEEWESPSRAIANKESSLIEEVLEPELILRVDPTRSKIVRTKYPIGRIAIGNSGIVDVNEFDPQEIEVIGKQFGETTMTLWFPMADGSTRVLRYRLRIENDDVSALDQNLGIPELQDKINELFPNSQVFLFPIEDKLIVRGQARDAKEAQGILQLLGEQFAGGGNRGFGQGNRFGGNNFANTVDSQRAGGANFVGAGAGVNASDLERRRLGLDVDCLLYTSPSPRD